jgi:hypothetical protein
MGRRGRHRATRTLQQVADVNADVDNAICMS